MRRALGLPAVALAVLSALCLAGAGVYASTGVGISPGIIRVDEQLVPGGIYDLPPVSVRNTGTEASDYRVALARMAEQEELEPPEEFIVMSPTAFYLAPGESRTVSLKLSIPVKARPGDYLAYIEARPVAEGGGMSVGVAAATKLYFSIRPANVLVAITNAIGNFFSRTAPASYIVLGVLVAGVAVFFLRKHIRIDIKIGRRK